MSLDPYTNIECILSQESRGNSGLSIESYGKTYTFYTNFEAPNPRLRELVRENPDNLRYLEELTSTTNRVLYKGELMRRGFIVLPADEIMAKMQNGNDINSHLAAFVADDLDRSLFWKFQKAVQGSAPDALDIIRGGKVAIDSKDIGLLIDQTLMQDEFRPLLEFYDEHMERVRELGGSATASELVI